MQNKKPLYILITAVILGILVLLTIKSIAQKDAPEPNPEAISSENPRYTCPGILITNPPIASYEIVGPNPEDIAIPDALVPTVTFPLTVSGIIHPVGTRAGDWAVFEGVAGSVSFASYENNEVLLGTPIPIVLTGEWMNMDPKPFSVTIPELPSSRIYSNQINLIITDSDASGENSHQCNVLLNI